MHQRSQLAKEGRPPAAAHSQDYRRESRPAPKQAAVRTAAMAQRQLQEAADASAPVARGRHFQEIANGHAARQPAAALNDALRTSVPGADGAVQRRIRSTPAAAGPQVFIRRGRSGPHNTAANRAALAALRADRALNANPAARHANNEYEAGVVPGALHMAHHISDQTVQDTVAAAANAHNAGAGAGAWGPVNQLIVGIDPAAAPAAILPLPPNFLATANAAHASALGALGLAVAAVPAAPGMLPLPHGVASWGLLTALSSAIANSPMNLHLGLGTTNSSLGRLADPNSFQPPGPAGMLTRQISWRSLHMLNTLGAAPYRTHAAATAMAGTRAQAHALATPLPPLPAAFPPVVHSSGSPQHFTPLQ